MDEKINLKGSSISTQSYDVNDSSIKQNEIEIITVTIGRTKNTTNVKVLKDSSKYMNRISKLTSNDIYKDELDRKKQKRLKRIEIYEGLDEDIFVPINYPEQDKELDKKYRINKKGEIINVDTKQILLGTKTLKDYRQHVLIAVSGNKIVYSDHRLIAYTFLFNPNPKIYRIPNHIDSDTLNNTISNLEWLSISDNNTSEKQKPRKCKKNGLEETSKLIGFSGNLLDYTWLKHWKYKDVWVCKEGFISDGKRRIGCINRDGYIKAYIQSTKEYLHVHRIIMEFILKRDLKQDEFVDHIDTNRTNNEFSNLKLTNAKGNMNNPNTLNKYYKKIVLTDLFGDFVCYSNSDDIKNIVYKNYKLHRAKPDSGRISVARLLSHAFLGANYFCINVGDKKSLYKKMENVVYVFNKDKTKVVGAYSSTVTAEAYSGLYRDTIMRKVKNNTIAKDGCYYMRGPEAVKLVLSLGHGTAASFKPEDTN